MENTNNAGMITVKLAKFIYSCVKMMNAKEIKRRVLTNNTQPVNMLSVQP
jgi:signal-transduction protein with cAMP-binding, CBS, and nucleotidyltransferase domain